MSGNGWLARQRKGDLVDIAQSLGLKDYENFRKTDLELAIDEYLSDNTTRYQSDPKFLDYFKSRARAGGSPIKKEIPDLKPTSRRRAPKQVEEITPAAEEEDEEEDEEEEEEKEVADDNEQTALTTATQAAADAAQSTSTALTRTPGRVLAATARLQLPATPADVARAVDRGTVALRAQATSLLERSRLGEGTQLTREWLSTVHSVVSAIALFELYYLRPEVLPDRYAFTVPAVPALGTPDYPVHLPDMFALVTASFWAPALTWALTSVFLPSLAGYFFNLSGAAATPSHKAPGVRTRRSTAATAAAEQVEYAVDPVVFSIAKAVVTYVVYAQGVTFGGLIDPTSVSRINGALYSGWRGVLAGTAVSGLTAVYDAVLRK
ncbi:hypothetical protein B0J18DRAFT_157741 [Chaetomium sp. MPI-SDFR-AT-0129]|nr:hypothetical protein B0J18DRAFT_157741 [Chaetomium sp. MPI-SDFR-AT-0129]